MACAGRRARGGCTARPPRRRSAARRADCLKTSMPARWLSMKPCPFAGSTWWPRRDRPAERRRRAAARSASSFCLGRPARDVGARPQVAARDGVDGTSAPQSGCVPRRLSHLCIASPIFDEPDHRFDTADIRFPTSLALDGSDAMNPDPDYSAAYVRIATDAATASKGTASSSRSGAATTSRSPPSRRSASASSAATSRSCSPTWARSWRELVHDSQLRWLGPEKGVMHMAIGAVVNALWDLKAKRAGLPLWQLLAGDEPRGAGRPRRLPLPDRRAHARRGARDPARRGARARRAPRASCSRPATPPTRRRRAGSATTTRSSRGCAARPSPSGFAQIKLKVGGDLDDDVRRLEHRPRDRRTGHPDRRRRQPALGRRARRSSGCSALSRFDLAWIEEPTSPDDVLGHAAIARGVAPIPVATGEHMANRVMFKQFLQADALQVLQIDATRVAGVNENVAILLLAAKFGVPVCPHAGGVGLCEAVQHLSMFDFVAVSGSHGRPGDRVRRPPARALRDAGRGARRPLPGAHGPRRGDRDARGVGEGSPVAEPAARPPRVRGGERRQPLPAR